MRDGQCKDFLEQPNSSMKLCVLTSGHTGPHTDGNQQWSASLDSNYDLDQQMHNTFMEKCKPFLVGVKVMTPNGMGEIVRIINVADIQCPFEVKYVGYDCLTKVWRRKDLKLLPTSGSVEVIADRIPMTMQCSKFTMEMDCGATSIFHKRCILNEGHKGYCEFGVDVITGSTVEKPIKFVNIASDGQAVYALDDAGNVWKYDNVPGKWRKLDNPT